MPAGPIEWVHALAAMLAASIPVGILSGRTVKNNRDRSMQNRHRLVGDPDDPNQEGVLDIAYDTRERVQQLDRKIEDVKRESRQNRELILSKLDEMDGESVDGEFVFPDDDD